MNTKTKAPVKPEVKPPVQGVELKQPAQDKVKTAATTVTAPEGKKEPSPAEVLAILSKREKLIAENGEKLKGLKRLREEQDELQSWDIDNDPTAEIVIRGTHGLFKTSNSFVIRLCKANLEEAFDTRISQLEKELATAII